MFVLFALYHILGGLLVPRLVLVTENLALRQQLLVLHRSSNRPRLRHRDRLFWIALSQLWRDWRSILVIVKPETVIKWHRQGFKCYWRWKSRAGRVGRPRIDTLPRSLTRILCHFVCSFLLVMPWQPKASWQDPAGSTRWPNLTSQWNERAQPNISQIKAKPDQHSNHYRKENSAGEQDEAESKHDVGISKPGGEGFLGGP